MKGAFITVHHPLAQQVEIGCPLPAGHAFGSHPKGRPGSGTIARGPGSRTAGAGGGGSGGAGTGSGLRGAGQGGSSPQPPNWPYSRVTDYQADEDDDY